MENNWCILNVDKKKLIATLTIKTPDGDEITTITPTYIEQFLNEQGITFGINKIAIESLAHTLRYGQSIIVATGQPAINGKDGYTEFLIPVEDTKKPVIDEDGSVDYINSLKLAVVEKDQVFAKYVHPTKGEDGIDIFSNFIPPVPGRETLPLKGTGFTFDSDKEEYIASYDGHISVINNIITIDKLYIVHGDLDIDKGNINFNADVEITGDVRSGLSIQADGCIYIHGHVGACNIVSKKNIIISKGIQGHDKGRIVADGDVTCKFVERCTIVSKGNIWADSILNSQVSATGQIIVTSKSGVVIGSSILGIRGVIVKNAGNEAGINTVLCAGPPKELIEQMLSLAERCKKASNDNEKKKIYDELAPLNEFINISLKEAFIHVTGVSYAGVTIRIGRTTLLVTESFKDVTYQLKNSVIVANGS